MLTRARAKATNKPIFVDEQWSDAYIHNKDEQIDAMHAERVRDSGSGGWSDHDNDSSDDSDDNDDPDADVWRSDSDDSSDSDDDDNDDATHTTDAPVAATAYAIVTTNGRYYPQPLSSVSRFAGGGFLENVLWTALSVLVVPLFLYAALLKRYVPSHTPVHIKFKHRLTDDACFVQLQQRDAVAAAERELRRHARQSRCERALARVPRRRVLRRRVPRARPNGAACATLAQPRDQQQSERLQRNARARIRRVLCEQQQQLNGDAAARVASVSPRTCAVGGARSVGAARVLLPPPLAQGAAARERRDVRRAERRDGVRDGAAHVRPDLLARPDVCVCEREHLRTLDTCSEHGDRAARSSSCVCL